MHKNTEMPLHLFQVLEEEYASLHGPLPRDDDEADNPPLVLPGDEVWQPPRPVRAARDWLFRRGHIKDPVGLAAEVLQFENAKAAGMVASSARANEDEWARRNLAEFLRDEIDHAVLLDLVKLGERQRVRHDDPLVIRLEQEMSKLLKNSNLYHPDRFPDTWLSAGTKGLVRQRGAAEGFKDELLAHFNRMLLEEAFPQYIERVSNIRLMAVYRLMHQKRPSALCLSGGGIRSGTFALGILQGLARHGSLREFSYLSTVSGGGYIGGWLTAWLHRHPDGLEGVTHDLSNNSPVRKVDPGPRPLQYLRNYSNFLTPKVGLLTADTWAFVGIYLRNLLLNWLVFIPLLLAVLMLPRLVLNLTLAQPVKDAPRTIESVLAEQHRRNAIKEGGRVGAPAPTPAPPVTPETVKGLGDVPAHQRVVYEAKPFVTDAFYHVDGTGAHLYHRHILLLLGFIFGTWALAFIGFNRPAVRGVLRERSRYWRERTDQRSFLLWCLIPLLISAACLTTYWAWSREAAEADKSFWYFIGFGLAFTLTGWLIASAILRRIFDWREISVVELLALAGAGVIGGLFFWLVSLQRITDPVVSYGIHAREESGLGANFVWRLTHPPFAWTDWTRWGWYDWTTEIYVCAGVPLFMLAFWVATTFFVGVSSFSAKIKDEDREWWARFGAWLIIASLAWVVFNALVLFGPLLLLESPKLLAAVGGVSGLVSVLIGKSAVTAARDSAGDGKDQTTGTKALGLVGSALPLFGAVFLASFLALLSLAATGITRGVAMLADSTQGRVINGRQQGIVFGGDTTFSTEWMTNVPEAAPPAGTPAPPATAGAPAPTPTPSYTPANNGFREYVEYITPVVYPAPTPAPAPGATPTPEPTPCMAVCPKPSEADAELAAKQEADEKRKADPFTGAKIVHMNVLHHTSFRLTLLLMLLLFGFGLLISRLIDLNLFSLHGGYRNRLIRAFLGASRPSGERHPNPFTGFDPADDLSMHELRPSLLDEEDIRDQRRLAEGLRDKEHPLSRYLSSKGLLKNVEEEKSTSPSASLVRSLRLDLNTILETERLYLPLRWGDDSLDTEARYLQSKRAQDIMSRIRKFLGISLPTPNAPDAPALAKLAALRADYRVLLNRLVLEEAYPRTLKPGSYPPPPYQLMHVINTTLNLVGGDKLAWQQRKAEPFSITPLHSGCFRLGYRRSRDYGGRDSGGITMGTAAATSGAAASSNMGYYTTSPVISLLLTLFNVRLGWWLGNPGPAGNSTYHLSAPKLSVQPVVEEAFGLTDDRNKYVYLTDGGHFENLAIYEMVLRRCHFIVASDGAQDEDYDFTDLGNAVRKIRIDLGVPIEFPCVPIYKQPPDGKTGLYWAIGRIRYSCVDGIDEFDDGVLLYIKPAVYGSEPRDVLEYKKSFPAFPHQSTGDQFFDEPQFESYRALGSFIMDEICGPRFDPLDLREIIGRAFVKMREACDASDFDADFLAWLSRLTGMSFEVSGTGDGREKKEGEGGAGDAARKPDAPKT